MADKYILDEEGNPVEENGLLKWAMWFETAREKRRVASDNIGDSRISTVFLGLNHSFGASEPVLWESMVFGGDLDGECDRCGGTRKDAEAMHAKMVALVKAE